MRSLRSVSCLAWLACSFLPTFVSAAFIVPGAVWLDTQGNPVTARGAGMQQVNNTFYLVGGGGNGTAIYSSPDLTTWTNHGIVYPVNVSRPKFVFSQQTNKWSIVGQVGRQMNIASSSSILGPYTTVGNPFSPLGVNFTDFGLFSDADNNAYALYSADHNNDVISQFDPTRTNITSLVHQFNGAGLESPGMFKANDTYFFVASHKTAFLYNNNVAYSAQNLKGPWSVQSYIAPMGTRTWNSQNSHELTITGTKGSFTMYMGDRFVFPDLANSTYVWQPITVDPVTKLMSVQWHDVWEVDVASGTFSVPQGVIYEAEAGQLQGGAAVATCPTCSGNKLVTSISATNTLTINNVTGNGKPAWVSFHYINTDGLFGDINTVDADTLSLLKQRNATVSLNGGPQLALPQYDTNAGIVMSVPMLLNLNAGSANSITIGAAGNQTAGDLDYIAVYQQ